MFYELLKDNVFTAEFLVTRWEDCLKIELEKHVDKDIIDTAKCNDFDNIPVIKNRKPVGYVRTNDIKLNHVISMKDLYHKFDECIIDSRDKFEQLAKRFLNDGVDQYNLYFVVKNKDDVVGIITYADLNRKTTYIYTYAMLLFLEQWIKKCIIKKYSKNRILSDDWAKYLSDDRINELKKRQRKHTTLLNVCNLNDLIYVLRRDEELIELWPYKKSILGYAEEIRPKVAHPIKILVPRQNARKSLKHLKEFWEKMMQFIKDNDFNDKNGGWPVS